MRFYRGLFWGALAAVAFWAVATALVILTIDIFS